MIPLADGVGVVVSMVVVVVVVVVVVIVFRHFSMQDIPFLA